MKKVVFSTWCTDDYVEKVGLEGLKNSLQYFHPGIPHVIYDTKETERLYAKYGPWLKPYFMMPPTCLELAEEYDMVIHIDADSTVTGPLTELIESEEDIVGVRNTNSFGKAGCSPGITIENIPLFRFLNAGLVGVNKSSFWLDWNNFNKHEGEKYEGHENDTLCKLFNSEQYSTKILDPMGSNISYGLSNVWGTETHWDSWKDLYVREDKLMLDDPNTGVSMEVKVLHQAGGGASTYPMRPWMDSIVSDEVKDYLHKITA
jgi:hypothetical protein